MARTATHAARDNYKHGYRPHMTSAVKRQQRYPLLAASNLSLLFNLPHGIYGYQRKTDQEDIDIPW